MEQDRYNQNSKLFILGMGSLLVSLSLLSLALYIAPHVFWQWRYNIPEFIWTWREWLRETYEMSDPSSAWVMFLIFFIPAMLFGYISYICSNAIDNEIYGINSAKTVENNAIKPKDHTETMRTILKIVSLIILILVGLSMLQWLVTSPTSPSSP